MVAKESAIAKSTGSQNRADFSAPDAALLAVLYSKRKISKVEANYRQLSPRRRGKPIGMTKNSCIECKFNLGDEGACHVVRGKVDNELGVSKFFSARGSGMLPGDLVWEYVKTTGSKLLYEEGRVIEEGAEGFQCKDCKYYLYSRGCLLIRGMFRPDMSCGFVVRINHGTEV